jgi:hypothetical protein
MSPQTIVVVVSSGASTPRWYGTRVLAFPQHGLVLLAMPKCGSTSIERAVSRRAGIRFTGGGLRHMPMSEFERFVQPLLDQAGHPRESYEVACLFREPVDWLRSWWRFRSRPTLRDDPTRGQNYTGGMSFEEFTEAYIDGSQPCAQVDGGSQSTFVRGLDGRVGVDRIFRYEEMGTFVAYLENVLGHEVELSRRNVSPRRRSIGLSGEARARLLRHLRPEYEIYQDSPSGSTVRRHRP